MYHQVLTRIKLKIMSSKWLGLKIYGENIIYYKNIKFLKIYIRPCHKFNQLKHLKMPGLKIYGENIIYSKNIKFFKFSITNYM